MQSKVSMVVPCYNKEKYIGAMLESVYRQLWNNIELILINDGSTDGTRDIISEWEPKLRARGYDVVIADQENAGCCAAVKEGLLKIHGAYFCTVDCDDLLLPEYVSRMAGWLEKHPEYEWGMCDFMTLEDIFDEKAQPIRDEDKITPGGESFLDDFMFARFCKYVWRILTRTDYLRKCIDIAKFPARRSATHEPAFYVPLIAGSGRVKVFRDKLYKYNFGCDGLSKHTSMQKRKAYETDYLNMIAVALKETDIAADECVRLQKIAELNALRVLSFTAIGPNEQADVFCEHVRELAAGLNGFFSPQKKIDAARLCRDDIPTIWKCAELRLFGYTNAETPNILRALPNGRIIGYGVLGKAAAARLPKLSGTPLDPELLWDISAKEDSSIAGKAVLRPEWNSLSPGDTVLVFPRDENLRKNIAAELLALGVNKVLYSEDITECTAAYAYPEISAGYAANIDFYCNNRKTEA
jgi:glycosyltransferase involved in cell wall biosynthesis